VVKITIGSHQLLIAHSMSYDVVYCMRKKCTIGLVNDFVMKMIFIPILANIKVYL